MSTNLTTTSTPSRPVSLFSASNDYLFAVLNGRCDQAKLVDDLRDLLGVYFVPNETAKHRARQIALFVKDLADMSQDCVDWAIAEWRRKQDRRPSPASLRQLCMMRRHEASKIMHRGVDNLYPAPCSSLAPLPEAEREKRQAIIDRCVKSAGFVRHKGRYTLPSLVEEQKMERKPHWSETAALDDPRWAALRRARAENAIMPQETADA